MLQLTIRSPESEAGQSCSISGSSVTIGRNRLNDLCLDDGTVSDFHAEIVPDGHGGWKVNDHDSSNGTLLNNAKVKSQPIRSGDTLTFGAVETVVEPAQVDTDSDTDLGVDFDVPEVAADISPSEGGSEDLMSYSSLPTAQIDQAIAMHHARLSGKVDTVAKVPAAEVDPSANSKDAASAPSGEIAQMRDRLKHSLDELQALKDKHALQTRELESYQSRADLLEDPDADVTKLRIQMSDIKRRCDQAENKLEERDKEIARLEKLAEAGGAAAEGEGISAEEHKAAVAAAAAKAKASGEKQLGLQIAELCKQHRAEIKELKKRPATQSKAKQSNSGEIKALEKRIEELTAETEKQQSEQEAQSAEIEKYDTQLTEKTAEAKKLEKQVAELEGTIEHSQGDDATSSDEVRKLSAERDEQAALVEEREKELAELTTLHETAASQIRKARAERDKIKTENLQAVVELQDATSTIKKHSKKEAKLQQRIAELESQVEQSDAEIVAENEKLNAELQTSGERNAALEAQLAEAGEKITELEESIAGHEAEVVSKGAAVSVIQAELDEKEEAIATAEETEAKLRTSVAEQEKTINKLQAEIKNLSGESGNAAEQLAESQLKIESLNAELATLQQQQSEAGGAGKIVEKLESEADALRDGMEGLKREREQMQSDLDAERIKLGRERVEIDAERVSLRATLKESEKETEAAAEKLKIAEYEVEAKRRELDTELEELESTVIIERRRAEELTARAETAEQRAQKAAELVEENAERWDKAESGAKKEERRLAGLRRKLLRRRKLLEKLKGIGRREQLLKRKIAEAHGILRAAEEHKPGKAAPAVPRPWDVDKTIEDHESLLRKTRELEKKLIAKKAEWEKIDKDIQAGRGPLGDKARKIDVDEFSAALARNKELESTIEHLEIEKLSLIETVSAMKAKIAAAAAGAQGSMVP